MEEKTVDPGDITTVLMIQIGMAIDPLDLPNHLTPVLMLTTFNGAQRTAGTGTQSHFALPPVAFATLYAQLKFIAEHKLTLSQTAAFERHYQAAWDHMQQDREPK